MTARRLLVVDDDDSVREIAQLALELVGGWQVSTARSGKECIAAVHQQRPDAILMDVMMPDIDGPSTYIELHQDPSTSEIPVIFLTAKFQDEGPSQWPTLDLAGIIAKPFDPMTLSEKVAALLGWDD